jgi:hypothetical protein
LALVLALPLAAYAANRALADQVWKFSRLRTIVDARKWSNVPPPFSVVILLFVLLKALFERLLCRMMNALPDALSSRVRFARRYVNVDTMSTQSVEKWEGKANAEGVKQKRRVATKLLGMLKCEEEDRVVSGERMSMRENARGACGKPYVFQRSRCSAVSRILREMALRGPWVIVRMARLKIVRN